MRKRGTAVLRTLVAMLFVGLSSLPTRAEDVAIEFEGFDLTASLSLADGRTLKKNGVVLLLHDLMGSASAAPIAPLQNDLAARGINTLAINLSLGIDRRQAALDCTREQDHRFEDALDEIHAWVKWLEADGVRNVTLAGIGAGADQIALYATKTTQKAVRRVVLISPTTWSPETAEARYKNRFGRSLVDLRLDVEQKVAEDAGGTLLEGIGFLNCDHANVTARTFLSYYRDNAYFDTPSLIPQIKLPTLVVAAELDEVSPDLLTKMQQVPARPDLKFDVIEGAGRTFEAPFDAQLADRIKLFIDETARRG